MSKNMRKKKREERIKNKKKRSYKGFTLVELLAAIAILGLLIVMAFPTMRAIQSRNEQRKFEEYGRSVLSAAKLYVDSYYDDLFESAEDNHAELVEVDELKNKDLVKDINMSDSTCVPESSVLVVKYGDDFTYCLRLRCSSKDGSEEVYRNIDNSGSCASFKIAKLSYSATLGSETYTTDREAIVGESNVKTLTEQETGFPFAENQIELSNWASSDGEIGSLAPGAVIPKKISGDMDFVANADAFKYKVKYTSCTSDSSGNMDEGDCTYGESCPVAAYNYKKDYISFDYWEYNGKVVNAGTDLQEFFEENDIKVTNNMEVNLEAHCKKNKVYVKYDANGGTLASNHGSVVSLNGNKVLVNNKEIVHELLYDETLSENGLLDWNNPSYLNLEREDYTIKSEQAWMPVSGGATAPFDHNPAYEAKTLCPNVKNGDCTVTLKANWIYTSIKPTCSITVTNNPGGANGWYKGNVSIQLNTANEPESYGLATTKNSTNKVTTATISSEGSTTYYGYVSNGAGSNSCQLTVNLDKTPPTCGTASGGSKTWSKAKTRAVSVGCSDARSGCVSNPVTVNVGDQVTSKNVTITITDKAGNTANCTNKYNIYLDRTPPRYIDDYKNVTKHTTSGVNEWGGYWKDDLSGLSSANTGNHSYVRYCYGTRSGCSRKCTKSGKHGSNTHLGTIGIAKGYWLRKAAIADNFVTRSTKKDLVKLQTERNKGCQSGKYVVRAEYHVCDIVNNCDNRAIKHDFT